MRISVLGLALTVLLLALASPALAGPVRCQTYHEPTLNRLQTLCDEGTRAVSTWSPTLQRWQTTITASPRQTCTGQTSSRFCLPQCGLKPTVLDGRKSSNIHARPLTR